MPNGQSGSTNARSGHPFWGSAGDKLDSRPAPDARLIPPRPVGNNVPSSQWDGEERCQLMKRRLDPDRS